MQRKLLDVQREVLEVLDQVLRLNGRAKAMTRDTPLLGALPELDSMAVVAVITTLEERFAIVMADDELDGTTFATVGALTDLVEEKLNA
jgi:acyl carrier protein